MASPVRLQIQKPVVNISVEKLAQELEGLAQTQVRREQRPHLAGWSQGPGRGDGVGVPGLGRGLRAPVTEG